MTSRLCSKTLIRPFRGLIRRRSLPVMTRAGRSRRFREIVVAVSLKVSEASPGRLKRTLEYSDGRALTPPLAGPKVWPLDAPDTSRNNFGLVDEPPRRGVRHDPCRVLPEAEPRRKRVPATATYWTTRGSGRR